MNRPRSGLFDFGLAAFGAFCFGCTILFNRAVALSAIFLDESVKPVLAIGGVAILGGAALAALATPVPTEQKQATVSP